MNYSSTQSALDKALADKDPSIMEDKVIITSGIIGAFVLGWILGSQLNRP